MHLHLMKMCWPVTDSLNCWKFQPLEPQRQHQTGIIETQYKSLSPEISLHHCSSAPKFIWFLCLLQISESAYPQTWMWRKSNLPFLKEVCFHFQLPWSHFWISMTIDISGTSQLYKVTSKGRAVHGKQHTTPFKWILSSFVAQTMASSMHLKSFCSTLENTHVTGTNF